jgi:hypothetical protein
VTALWLAAAALLAQTEPGAHLDAPTRRFAVVVGWNAPPRADLPSLRYADDDAVRWAILLRSFGADVQLLTDLDPESRRLYAGAAPAAEKPTRQALAAALDRVTAGIVAAKAQGARAVLYFVYAGHGDVADGEGYVALADGRFFRRDLESEVLARSRADINHVIVDACRSFYFVYGRGPGGQRRPWQGSYFSSEAAARFPNTGFLLSSSSGAPSHEWEEFQAGIFSHEVRSGLLGAADANGDRRIDYREIEAFVRVANVSVRNERFRPQIFARAPRAGGADLLDLGANVGGGAAAEVRIDAGGSRRQALEDALGVRWADLHPAAGQVVTLRLPAVAWADGPFFLRATDGDLEFRVPARQSSRLSALEPQRSTVVRRGAVHEAFLQLFERPFDDAAFTLPPDLTARAEAPDEPVDQPSPWRATAFGLMAAGGVGVAAAGGLWWSARSLREDGLAADGLEREALNARIAERNTWTLVSGVAGAALLGAGGALWWWDRSRRTRDVDARADAVSFVPLRGGGLLQLTWSTP